jgi:hypothetical protein
LNKLTKCYETILRKGIENEMSELKKNSPPLDESKMLEFRNSSFGLQFSLLMHRCFLCLFRNVTFIRVRTAQTIILGLLIDILFWGRNTWSQTDVRDKNGALFFICTSQFMLSIQAVLLTCII